MKQYLKVALQDKEGSYEEGEGEGEDGDGDAEVEVEGEAESEGERGESDVERGGASDEEERADSDRESEGGREVEVESEGEREEVEVSASGSERSHRAQPAEDYDDEEVQGEARGQRLFLNPQISWPFFRSQVYVFLTSYSVWAISCNRQRIGSGSLSLSITCYNLMEFVEQQK